MKHFSVLYLSSGSINRTVDLEKCWICYKIITNGWPKLKYHGKSAVIGIKKCLVYEDFYWASKIIWWILSGIFGDMKSLWTILVSLSDLYMISFENCIGPSTVLPNLSV